jgi:hypothetical protein
VVYGMVVIGRKVSLGLFAMLHMESWWPENRVSGAVKLVREEIDRWLLTECSCFRDATMPRLQRASEGSSYIVSNGFVRTLDRLRFLFRMYC